MSRQHPITSKGLGLGLAGLAASLAGSAALADVYTSVKVQGARVLPEADIAQTCGPLEGVELDEVDLSLVEDCLSYTGYFEKVAVRPEGQTLVIDVEEVEMRPGRIEGGIAYVSDLGLTGTLDYQQFNLIPDTYLSIRNSYHPENKSYDISVLRQDIGPQSLHVGLEASGIRTKYDDRSYRSRVDQFELFVGRTFDGGLRSDFGLGYRDQRLFALTSAASAQLRAEAGSTYAPFAHVSLGFEPESDTAFSYSAQLDGYAWNLGKDNTLLELRFEADARYAFSDSYSLHLSTSAGSVKGTKDKNPGLLDRGFLGGDSLRGFSPRGIGPLLGADRLGGDHYAMGSIELRRALGEWSESKVEGGVFLDVGSVWGLSNAVSPLIDDRRHLRASLGLSLNATLGKIPLQAYVAKPISHVSGDEEQVFGLMISTKF